MREFHAQCVAGLVGHHADVVVGERTGSAAFHVERGAKRAFHGGAAVTVEFERIGGLGGNVIKLAAVDGVGGCGRNFTRGNVFNLALITCRTDRNLRTICNFGGTGKTAVGNTVHGSAGHCGCISARARTCADSHGFFFVGFRAHSECRCTHFSGSRTRAESSGKRACSLGFHTHGNRGLSRLCTLITGAHCRAGQALVIRVHLDFGQIPIIAADSDRGIAIGTGIVPDGSGLSARRLSIRADGHRLGKSCCLCRPADGHRLPAGGFGNIGGRFVRTDHNRFLTRCLCFVTDGNRISFRGLCRVTNCHSANTFCPSAQTHSNRLCLCRFCTGADSDGIRTARSCRLRSAAAAANGNRICTGSLGEAAHRHRAFGDGITAVAQSQSTNAFSGRRRADGNRL